jgi:adenylate kinase
VSHENRQHPQKFKHPNNNLATTRMSRTSFRLLRNITILGPPGSGKGSYGRPIAKKWQVPILTASTILRNAAHAEIDLDSGRLVDCEIVTSYIFEYLCQSSMHKQPFMIDGFPRTLLQIQLMREWPIEKQVHVALQLDVPDFVCEAKMLGRRHCELCNGQFNIAAVYRQGFNLPPQMPDSCDRCIPDRNWTSRLDDTPAIVKERLQIHGDHQKPITDYFAINGRLLKFRPYNGMQDIHKMRESAEQWLTSLKFD